MYENLAKAAEDPDEARRLLGFVNAKWCGQYVFRGLVARRELESANPLHSALSGPTFVRTPSATATSMADERLPRP